MPRGRCVAVWHMRFEVAEFKFVASTRNKCIQCTRCGEKKMTHMLIREQKTRKRASMQQTIVTYIAACVHGRAYDDKYNYMQIFPLNCFEFVKLG